MSITLRVRGSKEIERKLKEIEPRFRKKVLSKAIRVAMKPILQDSKKRAPKRSGLLRKSLRLRAMKKSRVRVGMAVATSGGWFGGKNYYGAFQEFGWLPGKRMTGRDLNEWRVTEDFARALIEKGVRVRKNQTNPDGTAWIRPLGSRAPEGIETRVNQNNMRKHARRMGRTRVEGKHYVERAFTAGKQRAFETFTDEVQRNLHQVITTGGIK